MGKGKKRIPNYNPNPPVRQEPVKNSILDYMQEGNEYSSILGLKNVNIDARTELLRSLNEISAVRKRPVICYVANVVNSRISQSVSIDSADDAPFLEMLKSIPADQKAIDIILVTPGGSAETVDYWVKKLRSRFDNISFILPYKAMSAGTIFCMSGDELIMDEAAFFGPIDPQVPSKNGRYVPAQSILTLIADIQKRGQEQLAKGKQPDWTDVQILRNLDAKEIGNALNASKLSINLVSSYLKNYKFKEWTKHQDGSDVTDKDKEQRAAEIAAQLCEHSIWLSHSSRITREMAWDTCRLKITHPEEICLASAIKRFWALMCFLLENSMTTKVFASSYDYTIFRSQAPQK